VVAASPAGRTRAPPSRRGSTALREALSHRLRVPPEEIHVNNSADELLSIVGTAALEAGDEVVLHPSFEPYTTVALLAGARPIASPLAGYDTDLDDMRRRVTPRTKMVFVCSPHNPAATIVRRAALSAFLESLAADPPLVVLDEAYRDFCDDPDYPDGVALLARYPRLVVLRTFSKIAALAGLRVGYAVASAETIDRLNRVRAPYNVNRLGQVAALTALEDEDHWNKTRQVVIEERAFLSRELARRGFTFPPSQANFLLVKVPDGTLARERLLRAGLVVRDGAAILRQPPAHLGGAARGQRAVAGRDGQPRHRVPRGLTLGAPGRGSRGESPGLSHRRVLSSASERHRGAATLLRPGDPRQLRRPGPP
jgi:histidinol-phosphate aminotransferase